MYITNYIVYKHTRLVLVNYSSIEYTFIIKRKIALTFKQSWHLICANTITIIDLNLNILYKYSDNVNKTTLSNIT